MNVRYQVQYLRKKNKSYSQQIAGDFVSIEDAEFWYKIVEKQGAKEIKILVK